MKKATEKNTLGRPGDLNPNLNAYRILFSDDTQADRKPRITVSATLNSDGKPVFIIKENIYSEIPVDCLPKDIRQDLENFSWIKCMIKEACLSSRTKALANYSAKDGPNSVDSEEERNEQLGIWASIRGLPGLVAELEERILHGLALELSGLFNGPFLVVFQNGAGKIFGMNLTISEYEKLPAEYARILRMLREKTGDENLVRFQISLPKPVDELSKEYTMSLSLPDSLAENGFE